MFEVEPELAIPDKCRDCGIQCELGRQLLEMTLFRHVAGSAAEELVGDSGMQFDEMIDRAFPEEKADDIKAMFRKNAGNSLEEIDEAIDSCREEIDANAMSCGGVLRMRATKGDVTYTVNVCTSQRLYDRDGKLPKHVPVHIRADSATNPQ